MITRVEFMEIFMEDSGDWNGDNALQGLNIIKKYFSDNTTVLCGAGHEKIYSVNIDTLIEAGAVIEDVKELRRLNWDIEDETYLSCFV